MATKINQTFYGAENTFVSILRAPNIKTSPRTINDLVSLGVYDGGNLDATASPWGIGESSVSSQFAYFPTAGQYWKMFDTHNNKKNTPLFITYSTVGTNGFGSPSSLVGADATNANFTKAVYKNRTNPDTTISNNEIHSTMPVDNTSRVDLENTTKLQYVTYLDYQKVRLYVSMVYYVEPNGTTIKDTTLDRIINHNVNVGKIICFSWNIRDAGENVYDAPIRFSVGSYGLPIPEEYKTCYYGDADTWVRPWRMIDIVGHWNRQQNSSMAFSTFNTTDVPNTSSFDDVNANDNVRGYMAVTGWGSMSRKHQVFDDVSYHWEYGTATSDSNINNLNEVKTGDLYQSGTYFNFSYMELDGEYDDKNIAYANAILHELAFIGLPFCRKYADGNKLIGDNDIYVPIFDEHNVTTGDFRRGTDAITLPNAIWGDIFGDSMPDYDPDYDPDAPPSPNDDYGYLDNKPITNRVYSSNNRVYALTAAQYSQFINDINSLYLDDPDTGYASFQLDFKGTNPSDYIVGTYGYTFLPAGLIPNQTPEAIQIGAVTLPNAEGYRIAPSYIYNYRSLGEIDLTGAGDFKPFGDFRDFEPYTHIELYVPLCGNIELDPAAVIGHTIQIEIIFDIMTGNATACVYRDNKTLIATVAGQLAASLPLTSGRMGDYQNAVKSAENALKQNELKTTTAAATVAMGVGAALLAPETGGLSLAAYGAAITGGASLMSLSNQKNQIEYEIKHKQPSISVCSSANGAVAQNISSMYAVCYVKQCKMLSSYNAATYAHTVGHATVKNTTVGAETTEGGNSLIVCSNADLSGLPATAAEINAIQSLLTGGIYV